MTYRKDICSVAAIICCLVRPLVCPAALAVEPKQVMLLHSFGRDFRPWNEYARTIRTELIQKSPWPMDITEHSLVTARSPDEDPEIPFVEYLRALFAKRSPDIIVSVGAPAAAFVQRHRQQLFATTPMVFTAVDQRRVQYSILTANDAVVALRINYLAAVENILQVLPDIQNVMVVVGTSPIERFWKEEIGRELEPLANRIKISWTDELSFETLLKRASSLPPHSAIFWELMIVDAAGVVHEGGTPLTRLHAVANAPIFSYDETFFGNEIVGGPLLLTADTSRETAAVAIRILGGEKPSEIKTPVVQFASPRFDWREMQRWGISESRLPPGSSIYFRNPTLLEQYRWHIAVIAAVIFTQAALIIGLLYEHRRRQMAEIQSRNSMDELTQLNRRATAGELSAAIAHEIKQPLTGIVTMANAALRWLSNENPNIDRARETLNKVVAAGHHASDVITNVRGLFGKDKQEKTLTDLNELIRSVLVLVHIDLRKRNIETDVHLSEQLPPVTGNPIQLQQVILNLVMNAMESMDAVESRILSINSETTEHDGVHISISDTGSGIDIANLKRIFQPMFTTKARGMGMGLAICKSIIESHNGRIWVSAGVPRGSIFHFELPSRKSDLKTLRQARLKEDRPSTPSLADEVIE